MDGGRFQPPTSSDTHTHITRTLPRGTHVLMGYWLLACILPAPLPSDGLALARPQFRHLNQRITLMQEELQHMRQREAALEARLASREEVRRSRRWWRWGDPG